MILTYDDYLTAHDSLSLETMQRLHQEMITEIGTDPDALEIYGELVDKANEYGAIRANGLLMDREQKMEMDPRRTSCHDALIVKFNMMARYLKMQGKTASWRDELGYTEEDSGNRKRIGDFGCYLVFVNSVNGR